MNDIVNRTVSVDRQNDEKVQLKAKLYILVLFSGAV
jgi:hypothetical protein